MDESNKIMRVYNKSNSEIPIPPNFRDNNYYYYIPIPSILKFPFYKRNTYCIGTKKYYYINIIKKYIEDSILENDSENLIGLYEPFYIIELV